MDNIDHFAIAVADLERARAVWDGLLGQEPAVEELPAQGVRAALYPAGVELIEPLDAGNAVARFLRKRGESTHHVAFSVADLDARLRKLEARGVRLIHKTPVRGFGGSRVAFLHPSSTGGVLVELKEKS